MVRFSPVVRTCCLFSGEIHPFFSKIWKVLHLPICPNNFDGLNGGTLENLAYLCWEVFGIGIITFFPLYFLSLRRLISVTFSRFQKFQNILPLREFKIIKLDVIDGALRFDFLQLNKSNAKVLVIFFKVYEIKISET